MVDCCWATLAGAKAAAVVARVENRASFMFVVCVRCMVVCNATLEKYLRRRSCALCGGGSE